MTAKKKVLILCTENSCRSHMEEGILRNTAGDLFGVSSAGSDPAGYVHPNAVVVLKEIGIDISGHRSKHLDQFLTAGIDTVITVCDDANAACPIFPGEVIRHHWGFEDPPKAVRNGETEMDAFRRIRNEIRKVFEAYASGYRQAINPETSEFRIKQNTNPDQENMNMKEETTATQTKSESNEKPGFFKRIVDKVDTAMKVKADEKSQKSCCGGSGDGDDKGNKCC